jgi:hypothetical protein
VNVRKVVAIASLVLVSGLMAGRVRAGENDQSIKVTFSQLVMVPGHLLPAGTYWFEVMGKDDKQTVRILNEDQSRTCAVLQTINQDRPVTSGSGTEITIAEGTAGEPPAVLAWFYPGWMTGHEFVYPKPVEKKLAMAKHETEISGD